jgi:hypothetical protein
MPRSGSTMKCSLAFSAALLLVTSLAFAQNKQDPYRSKPQHSASPKSKGVKVASPHHVSSPAPVTTGKASSVNQQLSKLEHETNKTLNPPHKTAAASAAPATKSTDAASTKGAMTFSYQPPKTAPASPRAAQSQSSSRTGVRGRVVGTGK